MCDDYRGGDAFYNCTGLTEIKYNAVDLEDVAETRQYLIDGNYYTVYYPNRVFYNAGRDEEGIAVTIGKNVTKIPACLFYVDRFGEDSVSPKIVSVVFETGAVCESIGDYAFRGCYNLSSIVIPDSVTNIGSGALAECTNLMSVNIPENVTNIGGMLFYNCTNLTSVNIPENITNIGSRFFYNCTNLTSVNISENVTRIGENSFYNCVNLTEIKFNAIACEDLGNNGAFYRAGQNGEGITVTVGKEVTKIPANLFSPDYVNNPPKIVSVVFEEGSVCESIGDFAFCGCDRLTSIVIPDGVTSIGEYAFCDCINLTSVYYTGTAEEWSAITFDYANDYLTEATLYYYCETQPTTDGKWWHYVDGIPTAW